VIDFALQNNIFVTIDPKKRNFLKYNKTDIFKPNLKELKEGCEMGETETDDPVLKENIKRFMTEKQHKRLLLTLSANGVLICEKKESDFIFEHLPAHIRNISDVSGAGDTVISVASLCLVLGMDSKEIAAFANLAGGLVCEEMGVVAIDKEKYANEIIKCL
jgi:bifunctional ADP-heptose synthase (sugar kinase/adenylyltransferase)